MISPPSKPPSPVGSTSVATAISSQLANVVFIVSLNLALSLLIFRLKLKSECFQGKLSSDHLWYLSYNDLSTISAGSTNS